MSHEFELRFTEKSDQDMEELKNNYSKKAIAKAVIKSLRFIATNLKHPFLNTYKYDEFSGPNGEEIFESYAQNNAPGAYRIF
jgi:hypothetical protein